LESHFKDKPISQDKEGLLKYQHWLCRKELRLTPI